MENIEEIVGLGKGVSKLYATIDLEKARVGRTRILENEQTNPRWYESFHIYCAHLASNVIFTIKDDNPIGATLIGRAYVPVQELLDGEEIDRWVEILDEDKNPVRGGSKIHVKLQYFDVSKDPNWGRGIRSPKYLECHIHSTHRDKDVRTSVGLLKKDGLMETHDEETEHYFHNTDVYCVLCPRNPDDGGSIVQDIEISTMFTHHQKIVVVDSAMPNGDSQRRRIVSFVGGIDLCDGRYDSPFHSLFRTLDTAHHDDFHQPNFAGHSIEKGGPREPWHDIHSRLEGPIAWDVLFNFEQRWRKQGGKDLLVR
ncbi:hypothetical protein GH714_034291 [Hevea brasiliensis]|uniref:Phospholipase D alpha 1 n=1 Tax=Hevea brasiliensis TaxID=3981 RepID=A0A6A6NE26_HEVBR|nr:hypothetical protein GH714_034291 [Hevea brasiliensis]